MLSWFAERRHRRRTAQNLYGSIVAQTRAPAFYAELGVPDTVEGRFELLVLHVFLVLERLRAAGAKGDALAQQIVDIFVADMDTTMRELGVGDTVVAKKMRALADAFYDRLASYRDALGETGDGALKHLLRDNLQAGSATNDALTGILADYVLGTRQALEHQSWEKLEAGELNFYNVAA
jgi:cytochrome b pre-mRNA-processing protein 3